MKRLDNKGFTLTELLATLAVLSLVSTIVIYVAINVVNSAKNKSYLVTRNNVEKAAVSYLEENSDKINFISYNVDNKNIEYQCVTVQDLIDLSYFDKDVLNSKISEDKTIIASDYIYIERDKNSKTIKNSKLITDVNSDYSKICSNYNYKTKLEGNIYFEIPGGYAKEKDVSIKYCLNISNDKLFEYKYSFDPSDKSIYIGDTFEDNCLAKSIKVFDNGDLKAWIENTNIKESTSITGIDNKAPVIKIEPNGDDNYTKSKTININISDDLSGISSDSTIKYGFSKSKSEEPSSYKEVNVSTGNVKITEGSLTGGYYLWIKPSVKDKVGNENNSTLVSDVYKFDNTAPSIPTYIAKYRDGSGSYTSGSNANKEVVTDISTNEVDSGVEGIYYSKDKSSETKFNFGVSALTQNGSTWSGTESWDINDGKRDEIYFFKACDKVGNCSGWSEGFHIKYAVNKIYKVYIKYHSNGGSMSNKNADYTVNSTSKLVEYKGNSKFHSVSYGNSLGSNGLYDADNSGYIKLVKGAGYSLVSGKEWCTNSDGSGTCYDQKTQYSASDFCDASSSDCEVTLYANWKVNTLTIIYHANDGSLTTDSNNNGYSKNSDGVITKKVNGEDISNFHVIKYNGTIDIYDANNSKGIQLTRTGYSLVSGNEWYKKDSDGNKIYYNQSTSANYSATDICDSLKTGDCTIDLYANWKVNKLTIKYHANGGSLTTNSKNNGYRKNSDGVITKKVNGEDISNFHVVKYGNDVALKWANYSGGIQLTRTGYSIVSREEWCTNSDGSGTCYDQNPTSKYKAEKMCSKLSSGDCTIDLYANWKVNKLTIKYHANGGSLTTNSKNNGYRKNSDGVITKKVNGEDISNFHVVKYGNDVALKWANYSGGIQLTRTGYSIVSREEWCTNSDGSGTCYDQNPTSKYKAEKMCSKLSSGDCTIDLYANWKVNKLTIKYHANGGSLTTNSKNNGYRKNSDGVITKLVNGEYISNFHVIKYNGTIDIYNANNSKGIQLTRTGYSLVSGKEWYKKDSDGNKIYYNQSTSANYSATYICNSLKTGDCTVHLYANWKKNVCPTGYTKSSTSYDCEKLLGSASQSYTKTRRNCVQKTMSATKGSCNDFNFDDSACKSHSGCKLSDDYVMSSHLCNGTYNKCSTGTYSSSLKKCVYYGYSDAVKVENQKSCTVTTTTCKSQSDVNKGNYYISSCVKDGDYYCSSGTLRSKKCYSYASYE